MYTLYYEPDTASLAPHICLLHAGAPYRLTRVDRAKGGLDDPAYRRLNPHGRIPTLTIGDPDGGGYAMTEAAAICLKIAQDHPHEALMPEDGSKAYAQALSWLFYLTNTLQADTMVFHYARRYAATTDGIAQVRGEAGARLGSMLGQIDRSLKEGGPWLAGDAFSAADYFLLMVAGWLEQFAIPDPPSIRPTLSAYLRRAQDLPAAVEAYRIEGHGPYF